MKYHNFMNMNIGQQFRHIDLDNPRIFTKTSKGRYKDQFGFEDFMMDALTKRWLIIPPEIEE